MGALHTFVGTAQRRPHLLQLLSPRNRGGSAEMAHNRRRWSKVKAASKPSAKDSPGDSQKGKAANAGEMKPKEVVIGLSGATSEGTQGGESSTTEPMGEPSTEAAAELMREAPQAS